MPKSPPRAPALVTGWIILCAFCSCTGWILSALHQLNLAGYAVAFALGLAALIAWRKQIFREPLRRFSFQRLRRRFRRLFPLCYLILAALAALGGLLYAPSNYDALAYRIPRVLNWLADGHWSWIHTDFQRLNTRATGIEWLSVPLVAFTNTDRWLFVINVVSHLLLPGLVFSLFRRIGVKPRVAWHWMWLVPTGYGFLLQAGSIGNDLFGAVFALAAIDFALRAAAAKRIGDLCLSIVAAGLLTGSKASNLPLLLPCLVAWAPSLYSLRRNLIPVSGALSVALLVSFLPAAISNLVHCGDWTGAVAERSDAASLRGHALLKIGNNAVILTIQNLVPPIFPLAGAWNDAVQRPLPPGWRTKLEQNFEPAGAHWGLRELQQEEDAGLGCGLSLLVLAGLIGGGIPRQKTASPSSEPSTVAANPLPRLIVLSSFLALLAYMSKSGMSTAARLVIPYYGLCLPALLMPFQARVLRSTWWRTAAVAAFGVAALLTILSPARPLFPVWRVVASAGPADHGLWMRAQTVYAVYGQRADAFAPARKLFPPGLNVLGLVASDDPETSLWRPFGQRRIEHITHSDTRIELQARGVQYALVTKSEIEHLFQRTFDQWLTEMRGKVVGEVSLKLRAGAEPRNWVLINIEPSGSK